MSTRPQSIRAYRIDPLTRIPLLSRQEFDGIATGFLEQYAPEALENRAPVHIRGIAHRMGLTIIGDRRLSEDGAVQGMTCFTDGYIDEYLPDRDEFVPLAVRRGTVLLDPLAQGVGNAGVTRLTLAHECMHWYLHRAYYFALAQEGSGTATACRCTGEIPAESKLAHWTDTDWMEWQANGISPCVLMPREPFEARAEELRDQLTRQGVRGPYAAQVLWRKLAETFQVSQQAAAIRLRSLEKQ